MGFSEYVEQLGEESVRQFDRENPPSSLSGSGWRITIDWDAYEDGVKFTDVFAELLSTDGVNDVKALVIGCWEGGAEGEDNEQIVEALVSARDQFPQLTYLVVGDILQEECEVSWIIQSDMSPVLLAFPSLIELRIRGMEGLSLGRPTHDKLERLVLEGGGMPGSLVREVASGRLPQLTHLELWLGDDGYGRGVTVDDLQPILSGQAFPNLKYLGLRNDLELDTTVQWLQEASVLDRLDTLDLSLGALTDEGVETLVGNERLRSLRSLDLHHHFASPAALQRLKQSLPGVEVNDGDVQEADRYDDEVYRYNFVSE